MYKFNKFKNKSNLEAMLAQVVTRPVNSNRYFLRNWPRSFFIKVTMTAFFSIFIILMIYLATSHDQTYGGIILTNTNVEK